MKWSRLPLAFMFRGPYLYVTHFNSIEVCEIVPHVKQDRAGIHTFLDLASPRLVGHGIAPGTAYITSTTNTMLELICLKGHTTQAKAQDEPRRSVRQQQNVSRSSSASSCSSLKCPLSEASATQHSSTISRQSSTSSTSSSASSWASSVRRSPRFQNMSSSDEESVTSCSSLYKIFTPNKQGKFTAV